MKGALPKRINGGWKIRDIDRERVRFIVRTIVQPPKWPDDPFPEGLVSH